MGSSRPYTLYTFGTPNGWKVTILLEELGIDYELHTVDIFKGEQKEEWFKKINPNARIPALGPMQGQASHFFRFAKEKIPYGINRYQNETDRLYQVLNDSLEGKEWLANNEYSIADMASFPWVYAATIAGVSTDNKPNLQRWVERCLARPATSKGLDVPETNPLKTAQPGSDSFEKRIADVQNISVGADKK